jgi:hypothetical protein
VFFYFLYAGFFPAEIMWNIGSLEPYIKTIDWIKCIHNGMQSVI